ncbi:MAG: hypothetical protein ACXADY_16845 [Candidatus Hodarchaeales archaeon]|jgi:hypothetical protein
MPSENRESINSIPPFKFSYNHYLVGFLLICMLLFSGNSVTLNNTIDEIEAAKRSQVQLVVSCCKIICNFGEKS